MNQIEDQQYQNGNKLWSIPRLIQLSSKFKVYKLPIKHLNVWGIYRESPDTLDYVNELKKIRDADMKYPIIIGPDGSILDGRHRVLHALLNDLKYVKAVRFDKMPYRDAILEDN